MSATQLNHELEVCTQFNIAIFVDQCATLQHPFEARNQCALILKIIEANVKVPQTCNISSDLRNVILSLLQKDANLRPSVKDLLNEV